MDPVAVDLRVGERSTGRDDVGHCTAVGITLATFHNRESFAQVENTDGAASNEVRARTKSIVQSLSHRWRDQWSSEKLTGML